MTKNNVGTIQKLGIIYNMRTNMNSN